MRTREKARRHREEAKQEFEEKIRAENVEKLQKVLDKLKDNPNYKIPIKAKHRVPFLEDTAEWRYSTPGHPLKRLSLAGFINFSTRLSRSSWNDFQNYPEVEKELLKAFKSSAPPVEYPRWPEWYNYCEQVGRKRPDLASKCLLEGLCCYYEGLAPHEEDNQLLRAHLNRPLTSTPRRDGDGGPNTASKKRRAAPLVAPNPKKRATDPAEYDGTDTCSGGDGAGRDGTPQTEQRGLAVDSTSNPDVGPVNRSPWMMGVLNNPLVHSNDAPSHSARDSSAETTSYQERDGLADDPRQVGVPGTCPDMYRAGYYDAHVDTSWARSATASAPQLGVPFDKSHAVSVDSLLASDSSTQAPPATTASQFAVWHTTAQGGSPPTFSGHEIPSNNDTDLISGSMLPLTSGNSNSAIDTNHRGHSETHGIANTLRAISTGTGTTSGSHLGASTSHFAASTSTLADASVPAGPSNPLNPFPATLSLAVSPDHATRQSMLSSEPEYRPLLPSSSDFAIAEPPSRTCATSPAARTDHASASCEVYSNRPQPPSSCTGVLNGVSDRSRPSLGHTNLQSQRSGDPSKDDEQSVYYCDRKPYAILVGPDLEQRREPCREPGQELERGREVMTILNKYAQFAFGTFANRIRQRGTLSSVHIFMPLDRNEDMHMDCDVFRDEEIMRRLFPKATLEEPLLEDAHFDAIASVFGQRISDFMQRSSTRNKEGGLTTKCLQVENNPTGYRMMFRLCNNPQELFTSQTSRG